MCQERLGPYDLVTRSARDEPLYMAVAEGGVVAFSWVMSGFVKSC